MNPMLLAYMQQMQNMPPQQHAGGMAAPSSHPPVPMEHPPVNPFSAGTMAAIKSAKQSLGMDADEKRKAMGLAMLHFGSNMANPNIGQGGPLGAVAQSILPAVHAYQGEANRVQDTNAGLAQYMQQAQMQQNMLHYHALKEKEMMEHRERELEEKSRHNKEMEGLKGERYGMTNGDDPTTKKERTKENREIRKEMRDLLKSSPRGLKISQSLKNTIGETNTGPLASGLHSIPGIGPYLHGLAGFGKPADLSALEGDATQLALEEERSYPAKAQTVALLNTIQQTKPNKSLLKEENLRRATEKEEFFKKNIEKANFVRNFVKQKLGDEVDGLNAYEEYQAEEASPEIAPSQSQGEGEQRNTITVYDPKTKTTQEYPTTDYEKSKALAKAQKLRVVE